MGTFGERIDALAEEVGHGELEGKLEVDQVYAKYQHEGLDLNHPRGGGAMYLQKPLLEGASDHMQELASHALEPEGLRDGMKQVTEALSQGVMDHAPVEFDHLRRSGHPTVTDDGHVVYDRPPEVARLTEEELRALSRLRGGHPYGHEHAHDPLNREHHR